MEGEDLLSLLSDCDSLQSCPIALGFRLLGKRWTIEVVRQLFLGDSRFNDLMRHAPGVNPRILSLRLKELERYGLVSRSVSDDMPVSTEYRLTPSGRETISVIFEMAAFMMRNFPGEVFSDGVSRTPQQVEFEVRQTRTSRRVRQDVISV